MGATASIDVATRFFEESKRVGCHLDLNHKASIRVADEGVKLMPGNALVAETIEGPLHQVGDGKGVAGQLRTVDSQISKPVESNKFIPHSRLINQRSKLINSKEEKSPVMQSGGQNKFAGHVPQITKPENDASADVKPDSAIEEISKSHDISKSATNFAQEGMQAEMGNTDLIASECIMNHHNPQQKDGPKPLLQMQDIPPNMNKDTVPITDHASFIHKLGQSECPMIKEEGRAKPFNQIISTDNETLPLNERLDTNKLFPLTTDKVYPCIRKTDNNEIWDSLSHQMFWNAMLRQGWRWHKADMSPQEEENILSVYNANNQLAWREVLKWEALHADECAEPKLKMFSTLAKKYSLRARMRSWLGYELPFDRYDWIVDRNGKEVRYIIDYYDGGKLNSNFEFALLDVRPALDSFEALCDRIKVAMNWWTSSSQKSSKPVINPIPDLTNASEPLNLGQQLLRDDEKSAEIKPSRFIPYNLSDVEKDHEKKNSVS